MARRNGVTLIVTLLHCPPLTEVESAKSLLNWGFAVDGKVRPVGYLVSALPSAAAPAAAQSAAAQPAQARRAPARSSAGARPPAGASHSVASGGSGLAAAGFSCVALLAAGLGFAYSRRHRPAARDPRRRD
jgi:D-alanyl-D-alanine carboxypeptidase (penicillin-binding protein 5/6)